MIDGGVKSLDFSDFKKVAEIVKNKEPNNNHPQIIKIAEGMNLI